MYPGYFHHRYLMGYWGRGPSRLLWFAIGAASATWWVRRRECSNRSFGPCIRQPIQSPIGNTDTTQPSWPQSVTDIPRAINNIPQPAPVQHTTYSPSTIGEWEKRQDAQWELEKEHLAKISRQATDAMAELTEATLESVLATAESLKAKLAEHRAQREKQQKQIEEEMERQRRDPPRLV